MELIIAEKPSVGKAIADVLGAKESREGYLEGHGFYVSWCIGHLVELALPEAYDPAYVRWRYKDLPIIPENWKTVVSKDTEKQFNILRPLMNAQDVSRIVCATDAGREGELIFRLVYEKAGCTKPVRRLWISSMEESAILNGFRNMKDMSDYDNLYHAALCRSQADWLIGMNATRMYSLLYGPTLHIGRVMTPTLAMLVERENKIEHFEPENFYTVKLDLENGMTVKSERISEESVAQELMSTCQNAEAVVKSIQHTRKVDNPPHLYDLTTLQREANRLFGFSAQETLDYAQSLYEKKLITYPRTDSQYVPEVMQPQIAELSTRVAQSLPFASGLAIANKTQLVVNDRKVTDHHAILPTEGMIRNEHTVASLPAGVRDLLTLICTRMLCAVDEPCVTEEIAVTMECAGQPFTVKEKKVLQMGWRRIWQTFLGSLGGRVTQEKQEKESVLPPVLTEGMRFATSDAELLEGQTTPPEHHTEDTILHAMETAGKESLPEDAEHKGIGTPATRASILEKLMTTELVERSGDRRKRVLIPTEKGKALVAVLPEKLKSAEMTAEWEQRLKRIEKGEESADAFMADIQAYVQELIQDTSRAPEADSLFTPIRQKICSCPLCGAAITDRPKGFMCENRTCSFALWKTGGILAGAAHPLTADDVKELVEKGSIQKKGLVSTKTHTRYNATLHLDYKNGKPFLRPTFD